MKKIFTFVGVFYLANFITSFVAIFVASLVVLYHLFFSQVASAIVDFYPEMKLPLSARRSYTPMEYGVEIEVKGCARVFYAIAFGNIDRLQELLNENPQQIYQCRSHYFGTPLSAVIIAKKENAPAMMDLLLNFPGLKVEVEMKDRLQQTAVDVILQKIQEGTLHDFEQNLELLRKLFIKMAKVPQNYRQQLRKALKKQSITEEQKKQLKALFQLQEVRVGNYRKNILPSLSKLQLFSQKQFYCEPPAVDEFCLEGKAKGFLGNISWPWSSRELDPAVIEEMQQMKRMIEALKSDKDHLLAMEMETQHSLQEVRNQLLEPSGGDTVGGISDMGGAGGVDGISSIGSIRGISIGDKITLQRIEREHLRKLHLIQEKRSFEKHQNIRDYYRTLQEKLIGLFIAGHGVRSGYVRIEGGRLSLVGSVIKNVGAMIPVFNLLTSGVGELMIFGDATIRTNELKRMVKFGGSFARMEKLTEEVARHIVRAYVHADRANELNHDQGKKDALFMFKVIANKKGPFSPVFFLNRSNDNKAEADEEGEEDEIDKKIRNKMVEVLLYGRLSAYQCSPIQINFSTNTNANANANANSNANSNANTPQGDGYPLSVLDWQIEAFEADKKAKDADDKFLVLKSDFERRIQNLENHRYLIPRASAYCVGDGDGDDKMQMKVQLGNYELTLQELITDYLVTKERLEKIENALEGNYRELCYR